MPRESVAAAGLPLREPGQKLRVPLQLRGAVRQRTREAQAEAEAVQAAAEITAEVVEGYI